MSNQIEFTRINNDVNGNPRYVCHYSNLLTDSEKKEIKESGNDKLFGWIEIEYQYAIKKARKIGGKKYHNKQYGGGIVFQPFNIGDTEKSIIEVKQA
jgi:hypothetical protein